jgi:hypothetical protein
LSWDGDEPSAAATEEVFAPAAEESAPLPQAETVAPVAAAVLPEATVVEGEYTAVMRASSSSSQSPQGTDPMCLVLTGAEVEDSAIPEAIPVEGVVPEAEVATEAATEPAEVATPGVTEKEHGDALLEVNQKLSSVQQKSKTRSRSIQRRCPRPPRLVGVDSSF